MKSFNANKLLLAWETLQHWVDNKEVRAIAAQTGDSGGASESFYAGTDDAEGNIPVDHDSTFLIASPTKPFIATAIMLLVEEGILRTSDLVSKYIPEFGVGAKAGIRIAHLLTHTSGLPDMLPNNIELRKAGATLEEFQDHVNRVELVYAPGTRVHYQSTGILTLSTILSLVTSNSTPEFLSKRIFAPLGMTQTWLGCPTEVLKSDRPPVASMVESQDGHETWGWNSDYWRTLGAPWGGLISSVDDLGQFCAHLLRVLEGGDGIISRSTLRAMTSNQLEGFRKLRSGTSSAIPWGFGWQLNWPNHPRGFGAILPAETFGHWGATGTLVWMDPTRSVYGVILTNEPMGLEDRRQITFANMVRLAWD